MNSLRYYINLIQESELVQPQTVTKHVRKLDTNKLKSFQRKNSSKDTDAGAFAYVRDLNPHQVRLISYQAADIDLDPKLSYFEAVAPLMGSNPFVPTVNEIQLVQARNLSVGMQKPSYIMQRLWSYDRVPVLDLYAACKPIIESFGKSTDELDNQASEYTNLVYSGRLPSQELSANDPHQPIIWSIKSDKARDFRYDCIEPIVNAIDRNRKTTIPELQAVIDIIFDIKDQHSTFFIDVHEYNVMFRSIGRGGYQLVITDPIAT